MGLSEAYGSGDEEEKLATLKYFIGSGGALGEKVMIDTADCYGPFTNELLLGPFVQQNRARVFLATKFAVLRGPGGSWDGVRGDYEYVKEACEKSLGRLGVDCIDLTHRVDPKTPIEETVRALKELQDAGKIKHIGLSECSADTLRRASKVAKIAAVEWEYSLFTTDVETNGVLDACKELGIALVAYSPLGRGLIGSDWKTEGDIPADDFRKYLPRFKGDAFVANMKLVHSLRALAEKKNISANQLALKWVMALEKAGGYYFSTGGSEMIVDGSIKVKQGEIASFGSNSTQITFKDGSKDSFDVVVFATGYTGFPDTVASTLGEAYRESFDPVWGLDEEGEIRGVARESGIPNFFFAVGNLSACRMTSKVLALQIKAQILGRFGARYTYEAQRKAGELPDKTKFQAVANQNGHPEVVVDQE